MTMHSRRSFSCDVTPEDTLEVRPGGYVGRADFRVSYRDKVATVCLTAETIRDLIDYLEPFAAKRKTAMEKFEGLAVGAKFTRVGTAAYRPPAAECIKVTDDHYAVLGQAQIMRADAAFADGLYCDIEVPA